MSKWQFLIGIMASARRALRIWPLLPWEQRWLLVFFLVGLLYLPFAILMMARVIFSIISVHLLGVSSRGLYFSVPIEVVLGSVLIGLTVFFWLVINLKPFRRWFFPSGRKIDMQYFFLASRVAFLEKNGWFPSSFSVARRMRQKKAVFEAAYTFDLIKKLPASSNLTVVGTADLIMERRELENWLSAEFPLVSFEPAQHPQLR